MRIKYFFMLCTLLLSNVAFANYDVPELLSYWGNGQEEDACDTGHNLPKTACIGVSANQEDAKKCRAWNGNYNSGSIYVLNPSYKDEGVILMMVAKKITQTGAMFCPIQVNGRGCDDCRSWTTYTDLTNGKETECFWLCKKGYIGPKCEISVAVATESNMCYLAEEREIFQDYWNNLGALPTETNQNVERDIPMFGRAINTSCEGEKDYILAIESWDPNKHGAFVRQYVVEAVRWSHDWSAVNVFPMLQTEAQLVCLNGYEANSTQTACVERKDAVCERQELMKNLSDEDKRYYNDEPQNYNIIPDTNQTAHIKCKESGYAFVSASDKTCAKCDFKPGKGGITDNGLCVKCTGKGEVFSSTKQSCTSSKPIKKSELVYGPGDETKNKPSISDQCWTKFGDEYSDCVIKR